MEKVPRNTPWGMADYSRKVADGIWCLSTPSHGGYWVSRERLLQMPPKFRSCAYCPKNGQWFEEDCSWCGVVLSFPEYFGEEEVQAAKASYELYYVEKVIKGGRAC